MNPLIALLQGATEAAPEEITVTGARPPLRFQSRRSVDPQGPFPEENPYPAVPDWVDSTASERKGMFGTKGTLRNVLGAIGDAFLVQSGNKAVYGPRRQQEVEADALQGFTANPMLAIERLARVNPAAAEEMYLKQVQLDQQGGHYQAQAENNRIKADADASEAGDKKYQQYGRLFSQVAGAANPETYGRMKPILEMYKQRGGLGEEFVVPDAYDEALLQAYQEGGMPAQQQVTTDIRRQQVQTQERQGNERIAIAKQNADANTKRANRPPQGRAAPNPTNASLAERLIRKVEAGGTLTKGENAALNRLGYSEDRGRGRGSRRAPPALPPGFSIRKTN